MARGGDGAKMENDQEKEAMVEPEKRESRFGLGANKGAHPDAVTTCT